jgi:hypothetical protein
MKKLFHFGDSYGTVKYSGGNKHFCHHISDSIEYEYVSAFTNGGASNEIIFRKILEQLHNYKEGDIIFINFSFLSRGCFLNKITNKIESTNALYNEIYDHEIYNKKKYSRVLEENEGVLSLVDYYIKNPIDYNFRLFKLINPLFEYLISKKISIFYIFIEESSYTDTLLNCGTNIKFEDGFGNWLIKNNFHNNEDIHYSIGIQPMLADVILRKTDNLNQNCESKIQIPIEDVEYKTINYNLTKYKKKSLRLL